MVSPAVLDEIEMEIFENIEHEAYLGFVLVLAAVFLALFSSITPAMRVSAEGICEITS